MTRPLGQAQQSNVRRRSREPIAEPEDMHMTVAERNQLERITDEFLSLLNREKQEKPK